MNVTRALLAALIVASTIAGIWVASRATAEPSRISSVRRHPAFWLAVVTAMIYANQVLFTVYVIRVRNGDVGFIARYLPGGWFDLADDPWIRALAEHFAA